MKKGSEMKITALVKEYSCEEAITYIKN